MLKNIFFLLLCSSFLYAFDPVKFNMKHTGNGVYISNFSQNRDKAKFPRIAIVSVVISGSRKEMCESSSRGLPYHKIVSFCTKSKYLYAKENNYDFILFTKKINHLEGRNPTRLLEPAWTKIPAVIKAMRANYEWIFLTDADSVILNFSTKLEKFIDDNYSIIACSERADRVPGEFRAGSAVNTGQMLYKNCPLVKTILVEAWNRHHKFTKGSYEQSRINAVIREGRYCNEVFVHPCTAFNTPTRFFKKGMFMLHLFTYHNGALMTKLKEIEKNFGHIVTAIEEKQNKKR